jgi:hypothetical protein
MQFKLREQRGYDGEIVVVEKELATRPARVPAVRSGHGVIANASCTSCPPNPVLSQRLQSNTVHVSSTVLFHS